MHRRAQRWLGIICCFVLFILVFLSLHLNVMGRFIASGHYELGLLFFLFPGGAASFFSRDDRVVKPLAGAMLASPLCLLMAHLFLPVTRSFWQEVAWLLSAVFWSSLGSLCYLLFIMCRNRIRSHKKTDS
ncbi:MULTISPECIES: inner membrane protein YbjM [Cedecea]|uniref:Membrane protein n=1 Tax=Cedecea neteri TaxID=158822 RepID=A0A089PUQ3_9ENTR|nr:MULTISPECIES: inner membrane protein YbjM [Cedecea]AIR04082.1 membrane protein [Cedecea neteri]NWC63920.1 inner membrane protein YbjM [Cedecea sp. P7760]